MLSREFLKKWARQLGRAHPGDIVSLRREEAVEIMSTIRELQVRVAELEPDAKLGRMVLAAREAVLDYEMPFHQCTCCGGTKDYDAALYRYVSSHAPDCPWAALVKEMEALEAAGKEERCPGGSQP